MTAIQVKCQIYKFQKNFLKEYQKKIFKKYNYQLIKKQKNLF